MYLGRGGEFTVKTIDALKWQCSFLNSVRQNISDILQITTASFVSTLLKYNHFEISGTWRKTLLQKSEYKLLR